MATPLDSAAHKLQGMTLPDDWVVVERIERPPDATGSTFSVGYFVERGGVRAYLKALHYSSPFRSGHDSARVLQAMTSAHNHEVDVLEKCAGAGMDRVVRALGSGEVVVPGVAGLPNVSYLIFELADGDIRAALSTVGATFDYAWALRMLHHAATGLWQLHQNELAHQDVKPSNVLTFGQDSSKLGDLGRASQRGEHAPHDDEDHPGDPQYAPPELLYGHVAPGWIERRHASDLYLLASLVVHVLRRNAHCFDPWIRGSHAIAIRVGG